jgi:hypothetical protein
VFQTFGADSRCFMSNLTASVRSAILTCRLKVTLIPASVVVIHFNVSMHTRICLRIEHMQTHCHLQADTKEVASRPVCYRHRCTKDVVLELFILDKWWACPYDQYLQVRSHFSARNKCCISTLIIRQLKFLECFVKSSKCAEAFVTFAT